MPAFEACVTWPFTSLHESVERAAIRAPSQLGPVDRRLPDSSGYLPLRPLALGLLVDTMLYAATALLLAQTGGMIARAMRKKAGCCLSCGYDRTGLAPGSRCPECGAIPAGPTSPAQ
jgi:hypothetical protein